MGRALPLKFLKGRRTEIHQWFLKQYATSRHSNIVSHLNHDALSSQKNEWIFQRSSDSVQRFRELVFLIWCTYSIYKRRMQKGRELHANSFKNNNDTDSKAIGSLSHTIIVLAVRKFEFRLKKKAHTQKHHNGTGIHLTVDISVCYVQECPGCPTHQ